MVSYNENWEREINYFLPWLFDWLEGIWLFFYCYWHWILIGGIGMFLMWEYLETGNVIFILIVLCLPFILTSMNRGRIL